QNIEEGESSRSAFVYVPQWVILLRCRVDTSEWCRELMVHLAPPAAQEESNALTNDEHAGCGQRVRILENEKNYLSTANHDQATRIQLLEAELAKKDSVLTNAERMLTEGAKDHEKLTAQLGHAKIENFDCIQKLLPTVVSRNLNSHKKLYPMYDKLFEKKYPYVEKISRCYRHSVADLLKVHPDLIPSIGTSTPTISKALGGSGAPPKKKT
ncbi:hypothetical protein Tco_0050943, partial [Tanacetum coccineum]